MQIGIIGQIFGLTGIGRGPKAGESAPLVAEFGAPLLDPGADRGHNRVGIQLGVVNFKDSGAAL